MLDEKINNLELEIDNLVVKEEKKLINDEFIQQKGKKEDFILIKMMLDEFKLRLNDKIDKIQLDLKNL